MLIPDNTGIRGLIREPQLCSHTGTRISDIRHRTQSHTMTSSETTPSGSSPVRKPCMTRWTCWEAIRRMWIRPSHTLRQESVTPIRSISDFPKNPFCLSSVSPTTTTSASITSRHQCAPTAARFSEPITNGVSFGLSAVHGT